MNKFYKSGRQKHTATTDECIKVGSENKILFRSIICVLFYLSNFTEYWAYVPQRYYVQTLKI